MDVSNQNITIGGGRLAYLDALKCLGIILVIIGHVQLFGMDIEAYTSCSTLMLYSFNMPLFFFVSGFLSFKEKAIGVPEGLKKLKNKFLFLVIPAYVFYIAYNLWRGENKLDLFREGLGEYWFTFTLFEIFVIYYIANTISKTKVILASTLALISIIGICYLSFFSQYEISFLDFNHLAKYFQFFTLGIFAKMFMKQYDNLMNNEYLKAFSIISFFLLLFSIYQVGMPSVVFHFLRDIVLRYLGLYIVVSFFYCNQEAFNKDKNLNRWILKIGQNSLAIYLLQYFFMPDLSAYTTWLQGIDSLSIYAICIVYTIFITVLCMLFIELVSNSLFIKKYVLGKK